MKDKIYEKGLKFAIDIINLHTHLVNNDEFVISEQLLRSGNAVGVKISEAMDIYNLESMQIYSNDVFLERISIAIKQAHETKYWLALLKQSKPIEYKYDSYIVDINKIIKILCSIIKDCKKLKPK